MGSGLVWFPRLEQITPSRSQSRSKTPIQFPLRSNHGNLTIVRRSRKSRHLGSNAPWYLCQGSCNGPIKLLHVLWQSRKARNGHKRFGVSRVCVSRSPVIGRQVHFSCSDILESQDTLEHLKRCFRLVERHLVAGFVYSGEGEVAMLPDLAVFSARDHERSVAGLCKLGGVGVFDGEGGSLSAEPVTDVVCVAVDFVWSVICESE